MLKEGSNLKTVYTESGLAFVCRDNRLRPVSSRTSIVAPPFSATHVWDLLDTNEVHLKEGATRIESFDTAMAKASGNVFRLHSPTVPSRPHLMPWRSYSWLATAVPKDTYLTDNEDEDAYYSLNDHYMSVPQIEALSSKREDFMDKFIRRYLGWSPELFSKAHPVFCFDTEYWPHFFATLETDEGRELLKNVILMPPKFHVCKHMCESVIKSKPFLRHVFVPLMKEVLIYAQKKWDGVGKELQAKVDEAEKELARAKQAAEAATGTEEEAAAREKVAEAEAAKRTAAEEAAAVKDQLDSMIPLEPDAEEYDGADPDSTPASAVLPASLVTVEALLAATDDAEEEELESAEAAAEQATINTRFEFQYATQVSSLTLPVVRAQLGYYDVTYDANTLLADLKVLLKKHLVDKLNLPATKPRTAPEVEDTAKCNLGRLMSTLWHLFLRWDGAEWTHEDNPLRAQVIELARESYPGDDMSDDDDDAVIARACEASSFFHGLWTSFDVYIRLAREPIIQWEEGDLNPFLDSVVPMAYLIAGSKKPTVAKFMVMQLERLKLYAKEHPDVLRHLGANCGGIIEDKIEYQNARVGPFVNKHVGNITISQYVRASCIVTAVYKARREMDQAFSSNTQTRKDENTVIRYRTTKDSFTETNERVDTFVLGLFKKALAKEEGFLDTDWPYEDRLVEGEKVLRGVTVPATVKLTEKWRAPDTVPISQEARAEAEAAALVRSEDNDLWRWLKDRTVLQLKEELFMRGLPKSAKAKPLLVGRAYDHICANPGGFEKRGGGQGEWRPVGYMGELPPSEVGVGLAGGGEDAMEGAEGGGAEGGE